MQLIITDAWFAKSRSFQLNWVKIFVVLASLSIALVVLSAGLYHWVFLKGAREGWPIVGTLVRLVVKDEFAQRDRYMRENIDVLAKKLGEMQAKVLQLESLGERVSGLAGVNTSDLKVNQGQGGPFYHANVPTIEQLQEALHNLDVSATKRADLLMVVESRLFESRIKKLMLPTQVPVAAGNIGSVFGWRVDPISGQSALHTGLDFSADTGEPIYAAAGGVVVTQEFHSQYGNMIEIDHGSDLISRYAHSSKIFVKKGDLVKRGQKIAEVGTTGRSTGPHLHFEVLVQGVPQDPQKFLKAGSPLVPTPVAYGKALVGSAQR